jgi:preprotein translocase SecE subunit
MGREVREWADEGRVSRMPPETTEKPETSDEAPGGPGREDEAHDEADDRGSRQDVVKAKPDYAPPGKASAGSGFFTVYKKGQGYWTRMGTAAGALLIAGLTTYNLYVYLPVLIHFDTTPAGQARAHRVAALVAGIFLVAFAALSWWLMNKKDNVDFLIATDSEMKKVNWTSRKELIGSTKVVIIFMFLIAVFLFSTDIVFSYFFYLIGVLRHSPFGGGGTIGGG